MRDLFTLNPDVIFLNHGSFGATPRPVFEAYQRYQCELEWQPVDFVMNQLPERLSVARKALGDFLGTSAETVVYVPNATFGVNIVARSLALQPGDEVLTSNLEYGACDNAWQFMSQQRGFTVVRQPIRLPVASPDEIVEQLWQGVSAETRVIFLSHITSATALRLPIEAICQRAREAGILTVIDGAHAPGQIDLDLPTLGADFYVGNCHKWLMSPKGAAFLYARPEQQHRLEPLVVSWGWGDHAWGRGNSPFINHHQWLGTNDVAAYLAVPDAIQFRQDHDWDSVQARCHERVRISAEAISALTQLPPLSPWDARFVGQMVALPLPDIDPVWLKTRLIEDYSIEVPITEHQGQALIRVSVQGYNTPADLDALTAALSALLRDSAQ